MTIEFSVIFEQLQRQMQGAVLRNEPLAGHTTWRVGGRAELFIVPEDAADLERALQVLNQERCPWVVLGYGGNILVRDQGIRGCVIQTRKLNWLNIGDDGRIVAGAGLALMYLIRQSVQWGFGGIESLAGIPATLGGAVRLNVGAHGQEMAQVVTGAKICSADGCRMLTTQELGFAYRSSAVPRDSLVTEVTLQLKRVEREILEQNMVAAFEHRRNVHPNDGFNAGSVFKNPAVKAAWRLIDEAGLRGHRIGGARISEKHTNFIINDGRATAEDIERLIRLVQETVYNNSGVRLEPEVHVFGERGRG